MKIGLMWRSALKCLEVRNGNHFFGHHKKQHSSWVTFSQ